MTRCRSYCAALVAAFFLAAPATVASAQSGEGWTVTVKGNIVASPKYMGSNELGLIAYPSLSFRRPGAPEVFSSPDDGIGFAVIDTGQFRMGPVGRFVSSRKQSDDDKLVGIHDVKWTIEGGVFAEFFMLENRMRARAELRHGFRGQDGFVLNAGLDWIEHFNAWTFAIGPRLAIADSKSMNTNFGVTPLDAFLNPYVSAPFEARGGIRSVGLYASATYRIDPQWAVTVHGGYDRLVGDAAKSPITREIGSRDQFTLGAIVSYSFHFPGFGPFR